MLSCVYHGANMMAGLAVCNPSEAPLCPAAVHHDNHNLYTPASKYIIIATLLISHIVEEQLSNVVSLTGSLPCVFWQTN